MSCENSGLLAFLSCQIGAKEPALKLLLSVFAGYPLAFVYRKYVYNKEPTIQHLFFTLTGLSLGLWNYGLDIFHCVFTILCTYCCLFFLPGTFVSVVATFVFNLGYLLMGYYYTSTNDYDIIWTMPQCILCLRLIAVAFDLYDGRQDPEKLSAENKKVALKEIPTLTEMFGQCFFPSAFLVGPQFSMKRYQDFVSGKFNNKNCPPDSASAAARRFGLGLLYLVVFQILGLYVSDSYMESEEFGNEWMWKKMILMGVWGRFQLYKYISCWLLTEGACILFGMSQNGEKEDGTVKWDGVENIKLAVFENTLEFNDYIVAFNVNTNHWVAQYIYKRLKFLNNRHVSQFAALFFLAVWHGFHDGYYVCFFFEFMVILMERDIKSIVKKDERLSKLFGSEAMKIPLQIVLRLYTFTFMGWCLMPFGLLQFHRYWRAFGNVNYVGILLFVAWPVIYSPLVKLILKNTKTKNA